MISKKILQPSREDAVRITRSEKTAFIVLAYAATILDDLKKDLKERLEMVDHGADRLNSLSSGIDELLNDLRVTVPEKQRIGLQNIAKDFKMVLTPIATPGKTVAFTTTEEFRELVDFARAQCRECVEDDESCEKCGLFQLLTSILPLEDYHYSMLCPYNLGEWAK